MTRTADDISGRRRHSPGMVGSPDSEILLEVNRMRGAMEVRAV